MEIYIKCTSTEELQQAFEEVSKIDLNKFQSGSSIFFELQSDNDNNDGIQEGSSKSTASE